MTSLSTSSVSRWLLPVCWLCLLGVFVMLRIDTTSRVYFFGDDNVVLAVIDDMVATGNWQPDWNRASKSLGDHHSEFAAAEVARTHTPHAHHYNFSSYLLLAGGIVKLLRLLSITTPTATLLHHLSLLWDLASLAILVFVCRQLSPAGQQHRLAMTAATLFCFIPLGVQGAHYLRPDSFLTFLGCAILALSLRIQHSALAAAASGLMLGLAAGVKPSQLMLGIFPAMSLLPILLSRRDQATALQITRQGIMLLATLALTTVAIFRIGNIGFDDYRNSLITIYNYYIAPAPLDALAHYTYLNQLLNIGHYFFATLGAPLLLGLLIGTASALQQRASRNLLLLAVPCALFVLYFASVPAFFDRSFCPLLVPLCILCAQGLTILMDAIRLPASPALAMLFALTCSYQPVMIDHALQTNLLREHHDDKRQAFQKTLKAQWPDFWFRQIDRNDMFTYQPPAKPPKNPRIYIAEDFNNENSRRYIEQLQRSDFVPIGEFRGDFAALPNCSLLTVHQAARYVYFVRRDELPAGNSSSP